MPPHDPEPDPGEHHQRARSHDKLQPVVTRGVAARGVVVRGGTVNGDVHGTAVVADGGTVIGNVHNVVQIGHHNVIGELGPYGANSLVGNVSGSAVQAGWIGRVTSNGRKLWPLD